MESNFPAGAILTLKEAALFLKICAKTMLPTDFERFNFVAFNQTQHRFGANLQKQSGLF